MPLALASPQASPLSPLSGFSRCSPLLCPTSFLRGFCLCPGRFQAQPMLRPACPHLYLHPYPHLSLSGSSGNMKILQKAGWSGVGVHSNPLPPAPWWEAEAPEEARQQLYPPCYCIEKHLNQKLRRITQQNFLMKKIQHHTLRWNLPSIPPPF